MKTRQRITIDQAAVELAKRGIVLGRPQPWQAGSRETSYSVTLATGEVVSMTAKQIVASL